MKVKNRNNSYSYPEISLKVRMASSALKQIVHTNLKITTFVQIKHVHHSLL